MISSWLHSLKDWSLLKTRGGSYRNKIEELDRSLTQIEQGLSPYIDDAARHEQRLQSLQNELIALEETCEEAKTRAREALDRFEGSSLNKGVRLLPFSSIFGAHVGDIVRVLDRQIEQLKNKSGREIEVQDDLLERLNGEVKTKAHLFCVIEATPERLVLSHRLAYIREKEIK